MKAAEYRKLRKSIGTFEQAARLLGVSVSTVFRREKGDLDINPEAEYAIRWVAREYAKRTKRKAQ